MRILFSHRIQSRDGMAVHIDALVDAFRRDGHNVLIVGPRIFHQTAFGGENGSLARFRRLCPALLYEILELLYNTVVVLRLWRACVRFRPDCIYERYNLFFLGGTIVSRITRVPLHLEVNSPLAAERSDHGGLTLQRLATQLEGYVWRHADRVYPVTQVLGDIMVRAGVRPTAIIVNQNGVDPAQCEPAPNAAVAPIRSFKAFGVRPVTLGFVGFLRAWHGIDVVIAMLADMSQAQPVRLTIAGDGPARQDLEAQVSALGLRDRVDFLGLVPRHEISDVIASFDIAIQPKGLAYASPLKLFEYMVHSKAIVAPDQPNMREILEHGRTALLFEPDERGAMRRAIERLVADEALRVQLGRAARREVLDRNYTWQGNARRIANAVKAPVN